MGELLERLAPALEGAEVRRWEGALASAEVEVPADRAGWVPQIVGAVERAAGQGGRFAAWIAEEEEPWAVRLGGMGEAMAGKGCGFSPVPARTP